MGLVSVIIPNHNRPQCLTRAVKGVLAQTYRHFEIIVVDDGSETSPEALLQEFHDSRIRLLELQENYGPANARNIGVASSKGEFLAFLDSDDCWYSNYLEERIKFIKKNEADGVYGPAHLISNGRAVSISQTRNTNTSETFVNYLLSGRLRVPTSSLFIDKSTFQQVQFDIALRVHQDLDYFIRFAHKFNFVCDPNMHIKYHLDGPFRLSINFDFSSSLIFLAKYISEIESKYFFFYVLRKTALAYNKGENDVIKDYDALIKLKSKSANWIWKITALFYGHFPILFSLITDNFTNLLYWHKHKIDSIFIETGPDTKSFDQVSH